MPGAALTPPIWNSLGGPALTALLSAPVVVKTAHFMLHRSPPQTVVLDLPTGDAPDRPQSVDKKPDPALMPFGLALVVPKRHAKRAVTRNLVKRQMREAAGRHALTLRGGQWLIRLRSPFDLRQYPSAASAALRAAVRGELEQLLAKAAA